MGNKTKGLNVRELLKDTYSRLTERHDPQEIVLPNRALTEIANDSDYHRTRVGYMGYETAGLFEFDGSVWTIARGEACGSYPADPYDSDILALEFELKRPIKGGRTRKKTEKQIQEELGESIRRSEYFRNSLIYGKEDGNLIVSRNGRFGQRMLEILRPEIQRFIAKEPEYDSQLLSLSTLKPICTSSVKYKPEFADFLADSIEAVLK